MVKTKFTLRDGRIALVLGLSEGNLQRLKQGDPIYFDVGTMRIAESDRLGGVTIFYGPDEQAMAKRLREFIGPETDVIVVPRGDKRPQ